jgi:hypothetical protein
MVRTHAGAAALLAAAALSLVVLQSAGAGAPAPRSGPAGWQAPGPAAASVRPDDRAGARGPGGLGSLRVDARTASGFDWGDGAIGAAGGLAIGLAGVAVLVASRRRRPLATP